MTALHLSVEKRPSWWNGLSFLWFALHCSCDNPYTSLALKLGVISVFHIVCINGKCINKPFKDLKQNDKDKELESQCIYSSKHRLRISLALTPQNSVPHNLRWVLEKWQHLVLYSLCQSRAPELCREFCLYLKAVKHKAAKPIQTVAQPGLLSMGRWCPTAHLLLLHHFSRQLHCPGEPHLPLDLF